MGTGADGNAAPSCDIEGSQASLLPDNNYIIGTGLKLGDGLNRPLIYIRKNTRSPSWKDIVLTGNRPAQSGWTDGPNGKLYTVMLENDAAGRHVEAGVRMDGVTIRDGYNGNFYQGFGRGTTWWREVWSSYSGQSTGDQSAVFAGFDATLINSQAGSNEGDGYFFVSGSQYQLIGGAVFLNKGRGIRVNGYKVQHAIFSNLNIQGNYMEGVSIDANTPYAGSQAAILALSNNVFEGNSAAGSGTYSDVKINANVTVTMSGVGFPGRVLTTGTLASTLPKYNVEIIGTTRVSMSAISVGSAPGAGSSNTLGFTNQCAQITGDYPGVCQWTPVLKGDSVAGSPVYARQNGSLTRLGNTITATFNLDVSNIGGAAGSVIIGGLPLLSQSSSADYGSCSFSSWGGWTAPTGKSFLAAFVTPSSSSIYVYASGTNGAAATGSDAATFSQFRANTRLWGTCTYRVAS